MRKVECRSELVETHEGLEDIQSDVIREVWSRTGHFYFWGYIMLVMMELGCSVPTSQVRLVRCT